MKVAVTGASGLTGSLVVRKLQERGHTPLAVVRSQDKADELCASNANLDVALADVTGPDATASLETALDGADALIICTSAKPKLDFWSLPGVVFGKMMGNKDAKPRFSFPAGAAPRDIDYEGTRVQIAAAKAAGVSHVVLLSSMAGTMPEHFLNASMDKIVLWKRRAEMELIASGLEYTVIHPGGLLPHYGQKEPAPGADVRARAAAASSASSHPPLPSVSRRTESAGRGGGRCTDGSRRRRARHPSGGCGRALRARA